jgi:hypothetical protein
MIRTYMPKFVLLSIILSLSLLQNSYGLEQNDSLCGPRCLLAVCEDFHIKANLKEIMDLSHYSISGTTMLNLYKAAKEKKLPVVPLRTNIDGICNINGLCIAFVDGNHFLIFKGCKDDKVIIQNPPSPPEIISKKTFISRWKGETLVFSKQVEKKLSSEISQKNNSPALSKKVNVNEDFRNSIRRAAKIEFPDTVYDFGSVENGVKLSKVFSFKNTGNDTLDVSVRASCSCTGALLTGKRVSPRGSGKIEVTYDTKGRKGFSLQEVHVRTNDPDNELQKLKISATILSDIVLVPDKIWLGDVYKNSRITRKLLVYDSGNGKLRIKSIVAEPGIKIDILSFQKDKDGTMMVPLKVSIHTPDTLGVFNKKTIIRTNDPKIPEFMVAISGKVVGVTKVNPPVVYFGEVKSKTEKIYEVTLNTPKDRIIDFNISNSLPYIKTDIIPMNNNSKYKLSIKLQAPDNVMTLRDTVLVYIKGEKAPDQKIPLYAKIVF